MPKVFWDAVDDKVKLFPEAQVEPQNPPKYELLEDMANMTYLSEAAVVHNLATRYERFLIFTLSPWLLSCNVWMNSEMEDEIGNCVKW